MARYTFLNVYRVSPLSRINATLLICQLNIAITMTAINTSSLEEKGYDIEFIIGGIAILSLLSFAFWFVHTKNLMFVIFFLNF